MYLGELIKFLEACDQSTHVPVGFGKPHSYRGYYDELAFEPVTNTTVGAMLEAAKSALNQTFQGYKGGDYVMDEWTPVWLAQYGHCGEGIGPVLLAYMMGKPEDYTPEK